MGKGFILDDWDIGFQSDIKLHRTPTADDIQDGYEEDELIDDYDLPAHWLMMQMNNFCVGANYVIIQFITRKSFFLKNSIIQQQEVHMKVKLQEVLEALDGVGMDMEYYYDTKNEEILMIFDGMVNGETDPDLIEDIEEGFIEDYIPLPRQYDMNEYRMMEEFIYDLPAGRAQDALDVAIRGKGAFRRFKDRLYDFDLQEKWYKYRDDCYEQIARDWCERFGIEIEE